MKRNTILNKIIIVMILFIEILFLIGNTCYADIPVDKAKINMNAAKELEPQGKKVLGVILTVVAFISVAGFMILGIRYMYSSVDEKAKVKEAAIMYAIGVGLAFGITGIAKVVYEVLSKTL